MSCASHLHSSIPIKIFSDQHMVTYVQGKKRSNVGIKVTQDESFYVNACTYGMRMCAHQGIVFRNIMTQLLIMCE